ncbi:PAS domain-containing protein, partial [Staphylococcus aureus]
SERAVAAENTRIRQALDKVSTSVVLADGHHQIIYLNETAQTTFARNQHEIRKSLPGFDAHRLRGSNLEVFGPDTPERQLGGCTFRTIS